MELHDLDAVAPLLDLCINACVKEPRILCDVDLNGLHLREGLTLPTNICDKILKTYQTTGVCITDRILQMFADTKRCRLSRVNLRGSEITDYGLRIIAAHSPLELDIMGCSKLTVKSILSINRYCRNLRALHFDNWAQLADIDILPTKDDSMGESTFGGDFVFNCPEMRVFSVRFNPDHEPDESSCSKLQDIVATLLNPFDKISHLDLSGLGNMGPCGIDFGAMHWLENMRCLTALVLHNVIIPSEDAVEVLGTLKGLRFLDISQDDEDEVPLNYQNPERTLKRLMSNLTNLTSLDISGTNLAGLEPSEPLSHQFLPHGKDMNSGLLSRMETRSRCCIAGLESRHLEFLGLLNCAYNPSQRMDIPAEKVTGVSTEDQILLAIQTYYDRSGMVQKALDALFQHIRTETCDRMREELDAIVIAMRRHPLDRHIQISGSASLFYIIKNGVGKKIAMKDRRRAILTLVDAMEEHFDEPVMMRNGCLTLCHFDIPRDVLFTFKRIVLIMLKLIQPPSAHEDFVQGIAIYLLNSLACQVEGSEKQLVGDLGAVNLMLSVIRNKLDANQCDDIMEVAWSTLWNITDETAINCQRFLDGSGMALFIACLKAWQDKHDLLRNMMGLMGNIAEVKALRSNLMLSQFVSIFSDLLDSDSDGIEVSYNAAGVLSHMASDGPETWLVGTPSRESVLARMVGAIERWDLLSMRNINYRSFEPILRLLPVYDTPAVQHWATWALCNLTQVYPDKYCHLLEREGGLILLRAIVDDPRPNKRIKELASGVIKTVQEYCEQKTYEHRKQSKRKNDES